MPDENPFENDFLFPRIQKQNSIKDQIRALDRFRAAMSEEDKRSYDGLLQQVEKHSSISYLAPRQSPFEQLLLTMMIEVHKETERLKNEIRWKKEA